MNKLVNLYVIIKKVETFYGLEKGSLIGKSRVKVIAEARAIAMYICRKFTNYSLSEIGLYFNRHYTTVLHDIDKAETLLQYYSKNPFYQPILSFIKNYGSSELPNKRNKISNIKKSPTVKTKFELRKELFWRYDNEGLIDWSNNNGPVFKGQLVQIV